ncbi:MAG TPA: hypothetical protein PK530_09730 [Anaerolineales bacterium]|nr:hypothetical protein [Anaerolineales bacterium]
MYRRHFPRHFRRRPRFPFWIFFILFFVFMGKSGFWFWMFPLILVWVFGPMLWSISSNGRKWERDQDWDSSRNPLPPEWQTSTPPQTAGAQPVPPQAASQPARSTAGLPTTCPSCGGPINPTTLDWRATTPHCGYCGSNLKERP